MIPVSFQAYVRRHGPVWHASPLLTGAPLVQGRDPAVAVDVLEHTIRDAWKNVDEGDRDAIALLAWDPELTTTRVELPVGAGKAEVLRPVLVAAYDVGGARCAIVPRYGRAFAVPAGADWIDALVRAVRRWRKDLDEEDEEPPPEHEIRSERLLQAELVLRPGVRQTALAGSRRTRWLAGLGGDEDWSGPEAVAAIAAEVAPVRAGVPDDRSDTIVAAITAQPPTPVVLVGPSGTGRSTLVRDALAKLHEAVEEERRIQHLIALQRGEPPVEVPPAPKLYHLDPQRIVTGMSIVGAWQRRLEAALGWLRDRRRKEEKQAGGDVVLVDDPVGLARVGRSAGSDMVASVLVRSWVESAAFPMILAATPEQWHRLSELDRPFADLFRVIRVDPPDPQRVSSILAFHRGRLEQDLSMDFNAGGLERIVELERRYPGSRVSPGSVVDRMAVVAKAYEGTDEYDDVGAEQVEDTFASETGLRAEIASPATPLPDAPLRATLAAKLVDQPAAVDALVSAIHAVKSGLRTRGRPIASWLFVGPTGVGKTEAAKLLTRTLFSTDAALLRFDLNTFGDGGAVHRLLGGDGDGLLTSAVRRRPLAVVLLDEIEKAHPAVHDLLLQVLDEGRLTDGEGRVTSFETTIVVMTSNVGAAEIASGVGFSKDDEAVEKKYRSAVARAFRPELINRIDRIVPFGHLGPSALRAVAELQLQRLLARDGFRNRTALLDIAPDALDRVATAAHDPRFGARGLKRALERQIVAGAAEVLAGLRADEPVRLAIRQSETGVSFDVRRLGWAEPVPPRAPIEDLSAALAAIAALAEPLRPAAGLVARSPQPPDEPDHGEVLSLIDDLATLRERAAREEAPIPDSAYGAIRRAARARPPAEERRNRFPQRHAGRLSHERLSAGLRSLLIELARPEAPSEGDLALDVALTDVRARALVAGVPSTLAVTFRPETRRNDGFDAMAAACWAAWEALAARVGGALEGKGDRRTAHGVGLVALLRRDAGLHWWTPAADAPAVGALVLDGGPSDTIVRVYCPPASPKDTGAVQDLRTGEIVPFGQLRDRTPGWLLAAV